MYSAWQSLPWCCKTVCRLFHQRSSICTLCCHTYSGGGQPVRMGMYPDIRSDDVLHSDPGRYEYRRPSVPFCRCRTAFRSCFRELYTVSFCQMQNHCVIPGIIAGILYRAGGHFHDGAGGVGYMALQHSARQRNKHSGKCTLVCIPGCPLLLQACAELNIVHKFWGCPGMIKIRPFFRWILKYPDISHHLENRLRHAGCSSVLRMIKLSFTENPSGNWRELDRAIILLIRRQPEISSALWLCWKVREKRE